MCHEGVQRSVCCLGVALLGGAGDRRESENEAKEVRRQEVRKKGRKEGG